MDEGQRPFESIGCKNGAERLAGLGRVDDQSLAGEVLLLILGSFQPLADALDFRITDVAFERLLLVLEHFGVFRPAE